MSRLRHLARRLGKSGVAFFLILIIWLVSYLAEWDVALIVTFLLLLPLGFILAIRAFGFLRRHSLWSVSNRLVFVYSLFGILPILLFIVFVGLGGWALMNELAIYLAASALDRRLDTVNAAVEAVRGQPLNARLQAAPEITKAFRHGFPGLSIHVKDSNGFHVYPPDSPPLNVPQGWSDVNGLLVLDSHFYGWAHFIDSKQEISALAPLSDELVEDLVPHLGIIALVEDPTEGRTGPAATAGSLSVLTPDTLQSNPDFKFSIKNGSAQFTSHRSSRIPPAVTRFDLPIWWPATRPHYHLESPGKAYKGVLWIYSRPSAVLRSFFSNTEVLRGILFDCLLAVAFLFFLVELVAIYIGISLSRRITGAIDQLYEGTRRVTRGEFHHRIPVATHDQLGELGESFNQMTGNIERLLSVEKEKERLQTELEIAREVQSQLYPKEGPPTLGLKLTVRCDPARMVSGDYYDYQQISRGKLVFALGDVAGKGISAALLMATLHAALRAQITQYVPTSENDCADAPELDSARFVSALNKQIYAHTAPEKYATFFFAVFDRVSSVLTYTNAGHLSPLLFRNGDVVPLDSNGTVVGAFPFARYDSSCLSIHPGDLLVCYTDGITEPENAYGEMFGEERLIDLVKKNAHRDDHEIVSIVLDTVRAWTDSPELHDDMTILLARDIDPLVLQPS